MTAAKQVNRLTLTRSERRLALAVLPLVLIALGLVGYMLHGPFGTTPIAVQVPNWAIPGHSGEYHAALPDFIFIEANASPVTIAHETLHYQHPDWTECQVSDELASRGVRDYYNRTGRCGGVVVISVAGGAS